MWKLYIHALSLILNIPDSVNDTYGYRRQCYSSFTSLKSKHRNPNSKLLIGSPSTFWSTFSNSPINVCHTTQKNITPIIDISDINTSATDLATDFFYKISELEKESDTGRSDNLKSLWFFFAKKTKSYLKQT